MSEPAPKLYDDRYECPNCEMRIPLAWDVGHRHKCPFCGHEGVFRTIDETGTYRREDDDE